MQKFIDNSLDNLWNFSLQNKRFRITGLPADDGGRFFVRSVRFLIAILQKKGLLTRTAKFVLNKGECVKFT